MTLPRALVVLLAAAALAGCNGPSESQAATADRTDKTGKPGQPVGLAPVKVETAPVTTLKMPRFLTLTGSVLADRQSEVAANVAGRVTATYVERGQPVKAGQPLALVDSKAAGFQAAAAVAQSEAAKTQVQLAKQDCERADTLFSQGAIPKSEHQRLKAQCTAQLYQANAAQANADLAGKLAGDTVIRAPIDGVVGERYINVGEYVQAPTRVASVYGVDQVRVSISVPEPAVSRVSVGQTLDLEVSAYPERTFPAEVRYVSPALRPATRDLIIEAVAKNADGLLKPGMFATVRLATGEEEQPTVPVEAIKAEGTIKRLFLARNNQAFEVVVRTGVTRDGRIAVLEPLEQGTLVIVKPPPGLRDGAAIQ